MGIDKISPEKRSFIMASIRSKNTKTELKLRRNLWNAGLRFNVHVTSLHGKPDIIFSRKKIALFVDGDFWHGYEWEKLKPKLKNEFWITKIEKNMKRDAETNKKLAELGWQVIRVWEHDINNNMEKVVKDIKKVVRP